MIALVGVVYFATLDVVKVTSIMWRTQIYMLIGSKQTLPAPSFSKQVGGFLRRFSLYTLGFLHITQQKLPTPTLLFHTTVRSTRYQSDILKSVSGKIRLGLSGRFYSGGRAVASSSNSN